MAQPAASPSSENGQHSWTVVPGASGTRVVPPSPSSPVRLYWEYLSYLFRRPDPIPQQEQLEMGYRDFLQVCLAIQLGSSAGQYTCPLLLTARKSCHPWQIRLLNGALPLV